MTEESEKWREATWIQVRQRPDTETGSQPATESIQHPVHTNEDLTNPCYRRTVKTIGSIPSGAAIYQMSLFGE